MLNEESRRKIRGLMIDELVDILDDQEQRPDIYASMSFDDRISLAIDELCARKNSSRQNACSAQRSSGIRVQISIH